MLSANVEDRLKITIDFAQLELSGLRRGDWLNLRDDFRRFFEEKGEHGWWCSLFDIDGTYVLPDTGQSLDDYSEDGFRDLQVEVRAILGNFVDSRRKQVERRPIDIAGLNALATIEVTKTGARILGTPITVCYSLGGNKLIIRAQLRDAILFLLFQLLRAKEASRIVRCPGCSRIFLRVRKQQFCSQRCTVRLYMRNYRSTRSKDSKGQKEDMKPAQGKKPGRLKGPQKE